MSAGNRPCYLRLLDRNRARRALAEMQREMDELAGLPGDRLADRIAAAIAQRQPGRCELVADVTRARAWVDGREFPK